MKIAIFGANGTIGQRILDEALNRNHKVTVIARHPSKFEKTAENLKVVEGNATDSEVIAETVAGNEAVISAVGPTGGSPETVIDAAQALLEGTEKAGVQRLLFVGGAGSLEVAPGVKLIDAPQFPEAWKSIAQAHSDALDIFENSTADVDWVNISPPALIEPGTRTGKYRLGENQLLADEKGESRISAEDYAVALIDELENQAHHKQRITVAY